MHLRIKIAIPIMIFIFIMAAIFSYGKILEIDVHSTRTREKTSIFFITFKEKTFENRMYRDLLLHNKINNNPKWKILASYNFFSNKPVLTFPHYVAIHETDKIYDIFDLLEQSQNDKINIKNKLLLFNAYLTWLESDGREDSPFSDLQYKFMDDPKYQSVKNKYKSINNYIEAKYDIGSGRK